MAADAEESAQAATADIGGDVRRVAAANDSYIVLGSVVRVLKRSQLLRGAAGHQRLSGADVHVERAIALPGGIDRHVLAELIDQAVALVHQIVRRLAAGETGGNLPVEGGDAARQTIDLADVAPDLLLDACAVGGELRAVVLHLLHERLRLAERNLAL